MNKHLLSIIFGILMLFAVGNSAKATKQYPDYIIINGEKFELYVDWSFPSVLQLYYSATNQHSPFPMWSTANYRGHIATWVIRDSGLYLTQVDSRPHRGLTGTYFPDSQKRIDTVASPDYFGIHSVNGQSQMADGSVLADWFSGTIVARRFLNGDDLRVFYSKESSKKEKKQAGKRIEKQKKFNANAGDYYLYVRNGRVAEMRAINQDDMKRAREISDKDTADHEFMRKYQLLYLDQNYRMYHLAQGLSHDTVLAHGHGGRFDTGENEASLVMDYFDNDPLNWLFNRENFNVCGAPQAQIELINDSLFITGLKVVVLSGSMFETEAIDLLLDSIFPPDVLQNGRLFASWVNGRKTIQYTIFDDYEEFSYSKSYVDKIQRIEVKDGVVAHSQFYPTTFEQDQANGLDRPTHFCDPNKVCCTDFGLWLPVDVKKLPKVTEKAAYLGEKDAIRKFLQQHPLSDTTINGRFFIGFGLNRNGVADHFWMTDLRDSEVIDWGETILEAIRQLPQQWQPAKYAEKEAEEAQPVDSYQVLDVTISNGKFTSAYLHR